MERTSPVCVPHHNRIASSSSASSKERSVARIRNLNGYIGNGKRDHRFCSRALLCRHPG